MTEKDDCTGQLRRCQPWGGDELGRLYLVLGPAPKESSLDWEVEVYGEMYPGGHARLYALDSDVRSDDLISECPGDEG